MYCVDKVYLNGKFYTMENEGETVEAIAVRDGKIVFTGTTEEAEKLSAGEVVDMKKSPILPGMTDSHIHLVMDCEAKQRADLKNAASIEEVLSLMREKERTLEPGRWAQGTGLHIERLKERRFPNRHELDRVSLDRPVLVQTYCGHAFMLNSKAMELAGINKEFKYPIAGLVDYDDNGEPNGIVREGIYNDILVPLMGPILPTYEVKKQALAKELMDCARAGFTCISTYTAYSGDPLEYLYQYQELDQENRLPVRIVMNSSAPLARTIGAVTGVGNDKVMLGARKFFSDGSLSSRSAALLEDYSDEPGTRGVLVRSQEEMNKEILDAYSYGMEISIHAIGDHAMDMVLNAAENAVAKCGVKKRIRIIHAMLPAKGHIERMKNLPVILDVQPVFLRNWVELCESRIGAERMKHFIPLREYFDAGLIVTGGSDAPVEDFNPFIGIQCAVTRQDLAGNPPGGLVPEQKISVYEAVSMFTKNAAYCTNQEKKRGTISVGKFADFIVLNKDLFTAEQHKIYETEVIETVLGGQTVYKKAHK